MTAPWCPGCGGPLYRRVCLGYCTLRLVKGIRRPGPRMSDGLQAPTSSGGNEFVWDTTYLSETGQPLSVCRWIGYRVTPNGHRVRVWPAIARRAA